MMSFASVLLEAGTAYPSRTHMFISAFMVRIELFFNVLCCVVFLFFVLFFYCLLVFVLYLVLNIACVFVLSILDCGSVSL